MAASWAWDILDVSQYNDVVNHLVHGSRAIVLGQTEAGAATDHAIIKANEGISVVEWITVRAVHRSLAALKVWNGKGQLILDFLGVLDADTRFLAWVRISDPTNAAATVIHTTSVGGRLNTDAFLEPVGLRIGGVDVSRAAWYSGPRACLNVSEKVTVPTFKVMAEVDKYFELSSHPRSGAMVIHSVEETQPRSTVSHWMSRLRDCSSMWHPALYELVGGNDELAVSVPQIKFVGGMRMTEIVKVSS
jgi:hypothetical protein